MSNILRRLTLFSAIIVVVWSCKPENQAKSPEEPDGKLIKVDLVCHSDAPHRIPLNVNGSTDLVGIQVYSIQDKARNAYARGLFASMAEIPQIELYENREYSIDVSIVTNGQNLVYQRTSDRSYYRPFLSGLTPSPISNAFIYSTTPHTYLLRGDGDIDDNGARTTYHRPLWARYAGYSGEFTARDSSSINIVARRVYAALCLRVEGLASGQIEVNLLQSPTIKLTSADNFKDTTIIVSLGGTTPASEAWAKDGYNEMASCVITHTNSAGAQSTLTPEGGLKITLTRNHIIPITIRPDKIGQLMISIENGPMIKDDQIII